MDTKSKKNKGIFSWGCFFIGLNLVVGFTLLGLVGFSSLVGQGSVAHLTGTGELTQYPAFQQRMADYTSETLESMIGDRPDQWYRSWASEINNEVSLVEDRFNWAEMGTVVVKEANAERPK